MKINQQIRFEREKMGLSRDMFVKSLAEMTELEVSAKTNQRWEEGVLPTAIELQCLSEFFGIKASDLLDEEKDPFEISRNTLYEFGEMLRDYSSVDNLIDLMNVYYITKQKNCGFYAVPRYDIELQGTNSLLSAGNNYYQALRFTDYLFEWFELFQEKQTSENNRLYKTFIHQDPVGSRSYFDPRTILDVEEMILIKEGITSELNWFNQEVSEYIFDKSNGKINSNLSFIKRKIYS
ncbi:XRE family transcriptional regulator [Listeria sp. FSL L7-0229]|uniref:helix-turn-helix domain-containing protein n=1 Tax=Listeria cossartiae TaxID=2838249 RepID=UPI0016234C6F|nr:XRE family transcriptional regulator [Listeria cossartiae]MBC2191704.1 XRE family transcriptional regulator [Listeria cossartiae subsp. cossartiae]